MLTDEKYRGPTLQASARQHFFASGAEYVNFLFDAIRAHFDADFVPSLAVDFGCGVGRTTTALAQRAKHVLGVDVSARMLGEARENCRKLGATNVECQLLDHFMERPPESVDLVNAYIVFQHIPIREGEALMKSLLSMVRHGGVAAIHVVFKRSAPAWKRGLARLRGVVPFAHTLANFLQHKRGGEPHMQMNSYNLNRVFFLFQQSGYGHSYTVFTDHGGFQGILLIAQRSERRVP